MGNITMKQIYKLIAVIFGVIILWQLKIIALILLISFMLTVILLPFVRLLHKYKLPSTFAVLFPLLAFVGLLIGLGIYVGPAIADQLPRFVREFPAIFSELPLWEGLGIEETDFKELLRERFTDIGTLALGIGLTLLHAFGILLAVLVMTMYWLHGYDSIKATLVSYVPKRHQRSIEDIWYRIEVKLGRWFIGQVLISGTVGVMVWLTALSLGLPFAGVLGIIAALLEIIPLIGPILASVPAILLGLTISLEMGLITTLAYIIIQQIESHVLTPLLMGRAVHLHPIVVLMAFLTGTILFGVVGALLAVPTSLVFSAAVDSFRQEKLPG